MNSYSLTGKMTISKEILFITVAKKQQCLKSLILSLYFTTLIQLKNENEI